MQKLLTAIVIFVLVSCRLTEPDHTTKILDFESFSIEAPQSWTKIEKNGIDSYVGGISIGDNDTLGFDLGFYSNSLKEDIDSDRKNNVKWQTIDGYSAKIVYPRKSGNGITGIYIDSLWVSESDNVRFNLYGENLTPANQKKVLRTLRTLKFQKK